MQVDDIYEIEDISGNIELLRSKEFFKRVLKSLPLEVTYFSKGDLKEHETYTHSPYKFEVDTIYDAAAYRINYFVDFPSVDKISIRYTKDDQVYQQTFPTNQTIELPEAVIRLADLNFERYTELQNSGQNNDYFFRFNHVDHILNAYYPRLKVLLLSNAAKTVRISFADPNPVKARDIVGALASEFQDYDSERKKEGANKVLKFIDDQQKLVYEDLRNSEAKLQNFKKAHQVRENEDATITHMDRLRSLESDLLTLELQDRTLEEILSSMKDTNQVDAYQLLPLLAGGGFDRAMQQQADIMRNLLTQKGKASLQRYR